MKRFLFVLKKPAHSGGQVQEILDIILTTAAFDQSVSLLLVNDAVFHLKNGQYAQLQGLKDISAMFKALEIYDVTQIYVEQESLQERGLNAMDLYLPVKTVARHQIASLLKQFDVIFPG
jgi:tRNA 2-thiouridine synthesizing protein C